MNSSVGLVIGVGNKYRGDDGVGPAVAKLVRETLSNGVSVIEAVTDALSLIEMWDKRPLVFVVDCMVSNSDAGKVRRFDAISEDIPAELFDEYSTHSFSIVRAVELSEALGKLPEKLIIYGVEGDNFDSGSGLSPAVASAAYQVAECIITEIREFDGEATEDIQNA